ncbi:hypothetical protein G9P44_003055 [Scheffersomyces stipitis]|nr:hypothetical protein G9P44_003055 [Scheffersomyces stipitis]
MSNPSDILDSITGTGESPSFGVTVPPSIDGSAKSSRSNSDGSVIIEDDDDNFDDGYSSSSSSFKQSPQLRRSDSATSVSFIDLSKLIFANDFDFGFNLDTVGDSTKKRFNKMKSKTKETFNIYNPRQRSKDFIKIQEVFNQRLVKFDQRIHKNLQSSSTEKLFYAIAVFLIATAGFVIGKYPNYFPHFHTVLFAVLMPIRFYSYFKQSFQYYLADLCYYVNILLMLFIWVFPHSPTLFVSVFSLSLGTLSFAVITWRNSLVLHSIEKTTSSFIHVMPPITMFVLVHELDPDYIKSRYPAIASIDHWNFVHGIFWTSIYYTLWQVSYHYFITIRKKEQIDKGKVTSFTYLKKRNRKTPLGKFVNSLPYLWMQTTAFTLIQFGYQLLTMVFCPIWFKYKHACGAFVTFIFIWASYNGATYYIDVFGKRLEKEVEKLRQEINHLQQANEKLQFSPVARAQNLPDDVKPLGLKEKTDPEPIKFTT